MSPTKKIIAYWRDSLRDAELASLELTKGNHIRAPFSTLQKGRLSSKETEALFASLPARHPGNAGENSLTMPVIVAPIVASKKGRNGRWNKVLCPLLIPAQLSQDGHLRPDSEMPTPWIPRFLLEPTSSPLVLGSVDALDAFTEKNAIGSSPMDSLDSWLEIFDLGWRMLRHVANGEGETVLGNNGYTTEDNVAVINAANLRGMATNILNVYDYLLKQNQLHSLLQNIVRLQTAPPQPTLPINQWLAPAKLHLGSFNNQFPLSPSQREALYHLFTLSENDVLAVSGPPGTGKTTLLHSVIASLWVKAAIQGASPPIIAATSTNNQAVTNVIESLSDNNEIERWLPIPSFGLYLVNGKEKQAESAKQGIPSVNKFGNGFPDTVENVEFVEQATENYLKLCSLHFGRTIKTVDEAVVALHKALVEKNDAHSGIVEAAFQKAALEEKLAAIQAEYDSLQAYEASCQKRHITATEQLKRCRRLQRHWQQHVRSEPVSYRALGFLSGTKRKKESRNQQFLDKHMASMDVDPTDNAISQAIKRQIKIANMVVNDARLELAEARQLDDSYKKSVSAWESWRSRIAPQLEWTPLFTLEADGSHPDKQNLLNWLDTTLRYDLFILAVHYWEGRWLQEIAREEITSPDFKESRNQQTQEKKWRRYAMLTPCFVTTMHTGPSFFDYYNGKSTPLVGYIDLLIIDEAGQVTPEVSGAMFALAKQTLVVGDVKQIEPVWSIFKQVDYGNLTRNKLIENEADFSRLQTRGLTASSGSVMQMAQQASPYQISPLNGVAYERGMFLAEHRRCVPEIINYCNELAYNGRLRPMRPSLETHPWPHLGYVHIKGRSTTEQGSRKNEREAQTIADWIADNKETFEAHYQTELENIIGIITPFSAQKRALLSALSERGIALSKVGTVHALQGGERPIVLFSSVYTTRDANGYFFDRGPNMLNVAVSRAKDSFIVFGDMEIFNPQLNTPSGILARHLFADEANEMVEVPIPDRMETKADISINHVRTLDKHVRTLARAFERSEKRLIIISPFLRWRAVEADAICEKIRAAIERGVEVDIYIDREFNESLALPTAAKAAAALRESGATVHVCHNIHSKIVCMDDSVFIEGSFNWLSAERTMQNYTRYETSMIYTGSMVAQFIEEVVIDIQQRVSDIPQPTPSVS